MAQPDVDVFVRLERFYDAVPRDAAVAEDIGEFVLFVRQDEGWPLYARPRLGGGTPSAADITAVRRRQRELGEPEAFEWVHETTPDLLAVARSAGLDVLLAPLMVLEKPALVPDLPLSGAAIRFLDPASPGFAADLAATRAVGTLGFGAPAAAVAAGAPHPGPTGAPHPGPTGAPHRGPTGAPHRGPTGAPHREPAGAPHPGPAAAPLARRAGAPLTEPAGPRARDALPPPSSEAVESQRRRHLSGRFTSAVVESPDDGILAGGLVQRAGDVAEIAGVATLPSGRRRGYASQLTAALARHALRQGVDLVFLSAGDDDVARLYAKVGFRRIGTACIANPAPAPL